MMSTFETNFPIKTQTVDTFVRTRTYSQSIYACPAYVNESYRSNPVCPPGFGTTFQF